MKDAGDNVWSHNPRAGLLVFDKRNQATNAWPELLKSGGFGAEPIWFLPPGKARTVLAVSRSHHLAALRAALDGPPRKPATKGLPNVMGARASCPPGQAGSLPHYGDAATRGLAGGVASNREAPVCDG